jgi:CheY-like chemotaxis protein
MNRLFQRPTGPRRPSLSADRNGTAAPTSTFQEYLPATHDALCTLATSLMDSARMLRSVPLVVLLVDDCPFQQLLGCAMLSRWDILPQLASDGIEAVQLASEQDFDIIFMDLDMPVMNGLAASSEIRRIEREHDQFRPVPIVACSVPGSALNAQPWQIFGVNAILNKPCGPDEMGACLERWCPQKFGVARH